MTDEKENFTSEVIQAVQENVTLFHDQDKNGYAFIDSGRKNRCAEDKVNRFF